MPLPLERPAAVGMLATRRFDPRLERRRLMEDVERVDAARDDLPTVGHEIARNGAAPARASREESAVRDRDLDHLGRVERHEQSFTRDDAAATGTPPGRLVGEGPQRVPCVECPRLHAGAARYEHPIRRRPEHEQRPGHGLVPERRALAKIETDEARAVVRSQQHAARHDHRE